MGIAYLAAALAVVPGLLFVFNRLSRPPQRTAGGPAGEDEVPFADLAPQSVADEAERWLQGRS